MPRFHYQAKQSPTRMVEGTIVAENKKSAIEEAGRLGYYVLSMQEEGEAASHLFFTKVGLKQTTDFIRQLADLLESGFPIIRALDLLGSQTTNKILKAAIADVRERCAGGLSLSAAMAKNPDIFPRMFVVLSRAGETSGSLDTVFRRLVVFNEKQLEIRMRVQSALAYPILMAGVGFVTILVLLIYVVPRMAGIFQDLGSSLPVPTQILLWVSGFLSRYFVGVALAACIACAAGWSFYRTSQGRHYIDKFKLSLPVFGDLLKKTEITRFSQTLATLLESGAPILEALKVSADTADNVLLKEELSASIPAVKSGDRLSNSLSSSRVIPPAVVQMISVGEESGQLEKTLYKIASNYERESDQLVKVFLSLLEPSLILVLGAVVGFMVITILLPIFEISLSAK